jgi:hypothetical protein
VPSEIGAVLSEMAAKLGVAAEYLWGAVQRQVWVSAVLDVVVFVICAYALLALWRYALPAWRDERMDVFDKTIVLLFPGLVGLLVGVAAIAFLQGAVGRLLNPAFYALKFVLEVLR